MADVELQGTTCRDWEDIAVNVEAGRSFIYLADTGDNFYQRSSLTIYKFPEPEVQTCKPCLTMFRLESALLRDGLHHSFYTFFKVLYLL